METEKTARYYELRIDHLKTMFLNGQDRELRQGQEKIRQLVSEYKKLQNHDDVLVGVVDTIYGAINNNVNFKFA